MIEIIIFGSLVLCVLIALLMYWSTAPFLIKFIALPAAIGFSLFTIWQMILLAGAPINAVPKDGFRYVHHELLNGGKAIALWAHVDEYEDYRLYVFPYSRKTAKKLKEAQQEKKKGKEAKGKFKKTKQGFELSLSPGIPRKQTRPNKEQ